MSSTLVIALRVVSLISFVGLMSLMVRGRTSRPTRRARRSWSERKPVAANLVTSGLFFVSLFRSAAGVTSATVLPAMTGSLLAIAGAAIVLRARAEL